MKFELQLNDGSTRTFDVAYFRIGDETVWRNPGQPLLNQRFDTDEEPLVAPVMNFDREEKDKLDYTNNVAGLGHDKSKKQEKVRDYTGAAGGPVTNEEPLVIEPMVF